MCIWFPDNTPMLSSIRSLPLSSRLWVIPFQKTHSKSRSFLRFLPHGRPAKGEYVQEVEQIISEMKAGKRDKAEFWIDLPIKEGGEKHKILVRYFALRNKNEEYLGCLEASQDITDIQKITGEKRLLD